MIRALITKTNLYCLSIEKRLGLLTTSLLIGFIIIAFDMLYVTPSFESAYHGLQYSLLSNNPFDFEHSNPLRYRILPSLIGYITFLRGDLFFIIPLIFALLLVTSIYYVYREKKYDPLDSLLFTGLIGFSSTIYIQLQAAGYTDAVFYFFVFLSFAYIKRPVLSAVYFCLGMLTHESCIFLLPGLILYSRYANGTDIKQLFKYMGYLLVALIPLLIYRMWISSNVKVEYDLNFYFSKDNLSFAFKKMIDHIGAGGFYAFKLFWIFPLFMLYKARKDKQFVMLIASIITCVFLQLLIAFDATRIVCLAFPAILIAAEKMKSYYDPVKFTKFFLCLTVLNFFLLQYFMSADGLIPMTPSAIGWLLNH